MGPSASILLDNPLLTKHLRSRLRRSHIVPWLAIVALLSMTVVWAARAYGLNRTGMGLSLIIGLEGLILALIGSQQVGGAIGGARESGILEYHRVSPQPPSWLALGFFLGAPVREYLMFAVTIPFALILAFDSPLGVGGLLQLWVGLLLISWILHAVALLGGLMTKKPKAGSRGGAIGVVMLFIFLINPAGAGIFYVASGRIGDPKLGFFGMHLHWLVMALLYGAVIIGFLFLAATRRMRSERAHPFTKAEALACLVSLSLLVMGAVWPYTNGYPALAILTIYLLSLAAMVLITSVTPTQAEYVRGLRRAVHVGRRRPEWWRDEGTNRVATVLMCLVVLLGSAITWQRLIVPDAGGGSEATYSLPVSIAVFALATFALAMQYFAFRLPTTGASYLQLFVFVAWLLPLIIGAILATAGTTEQAGMIVLGLSPLAGITVSSTLIPNTEIPEAARLAALVPAIAFAFVFNSLLVALQRRMDHAVRQSLGPKREYGPFDGLDGANGKPAPDDEGLRAIAV